MKKIMILGASGHGRVIAEIAKLNGYDCIEFYDDNEQKRQCGPYPVVGKCEDTINEDSDCFLAFGNAEYRKRYSKVLSGKRMPNLVHPSAVVADDVRIGLGTVVMAGAVINPGARIGKYSIVNTCSSIDHDCDVGDYVHVAVGAHLCGTVEVGDNVWIGAGVTVSNNVSICGNCVIGAGTVVVKNIRKPGTYIGVPARRMEK